MPHPAEGSPLNPESVSTLAQEKTGGAREPTAATSLDQPLVFIFVLGLAAVLMLYACVDGPFYKIDDERYVTFGTRSAASSIDPEPGRMYIPLTYVVLKLDCWLFRRHVPDAPGGVLAWHWAPGFRLLNALYHMLAAFMLWRLLRRLGAGTGVSFLVAALWAGHPMACESVCWVAERKNTLVALFGFAMLLAGTLPREKLWRWPLIWILYAMAVMSKPSALGLLPVFVVLEMFILQKNSWRRPKDWLWTVGFVLFLLPVSLISAKYNMANIAYDMVLPPGGSWWTALLTDVDIFSRYACHVLLPIDLSFYYGVEPVVSLVDWRILVYGAVWIAGSAGLIWAAAPEKRLLAALGVFWFFSALAANSNVVATQFFMQDRYAYLSAPGLLLPVALGVQGLFVRYQRAPRELFAVGSCCALLFAALLALRSPLFHDSDRLDLDAAARQPKSAFAQLAASRVFKAELNRHLPGGPEPDAKMAEQCKKLALIHYEAASHAPDITNFSDLLRLQTMKAEVWLASGDFNRCRETLSGWLPPPNLKMLPDDPLSATVAFGRPIFNPIGYRPQILSHAWTLQAQATLSATFTPDLASGTRLSLCNQALEEVERALSIHLNDYEPHIVKARILWRRSALLVTTDLVASKRDGIAAISLLESVPAESSRFGLAKSVENEFTKSLE